ATAPTTRPMRIHQMMTESVMTMTSPKKALYGWVRFVGLTGFSGLAPPTAPSSSPALVASALLLVDVLDDLRLAGWAHVGGEVAGAGAGVDVAGGLRAAPRPPSGRGRRGPPRGRGA